MAARHELRAELDGLRDDLARPASAREKARPSPPHAAHDAAHDQATGQDRLDLAQLLKQIEAHLDDAAEDTEELVTAHPLAAIASAFAAGLMIGWLIGRR